MYMRIEDCIKSNVSSVTYQPRHQTCDWLGLFVKVSQDKSVEVIQHEMKRESAVKCAPCVINAFSYVFYR